MVVDVHTHHMAAAHWGSEWRENWQPAYGYEWPDLTPEAFDSAMAGVDAAIVFGISASSAGVKTPTDAIADFCAATETLTVGFMALDPSDSDALSQLEYGVSRGMQGIKLYPVLGDYEANGTRAASVLAQAERLGLVIMWHMGASPSVQGRLLLSEPLLLDEVAMRFPSLKQIIAHMGHPWQRETILLLRKHPNVYADVSGVWSRQLEGYMALVRAQEWGVTKKLLFGSDYPLWDPSDAIVRLRALADLMPGDLPRVDFDVVEGVLARDPLNELGLTPS